MNPEENQPQTPAAGPAPEPATPSDASAPAAEPAGPVLDSDVANAINELASAAAAAGGEPASTAPTTDAASAPAAEPASTPTEDAPAPAADPTTPAPEVVAFDDLTSTDASAPAVTPVAATGPATTDSAPAAAPAETSAPATGSPAPDIAAAITELDADAVIDSIDSPDTTPENSIPTAIGVDAVASNNVAAASPSSSVDGDSETSVFDAPAETPSEGGEDSEDDEGGAKILSSDDDDKKEEEPIEPAEPVPGSIGSALKYSATAPDHSEPTEKPKGLAALFAKKPKKTEATASAESSQPSSVVEKSTDDNKVPVSFGPAPDVPNPNAAKGKKNSTILALIIIGAVVLVGAIVAIIVFIMTSNNNNVTVTKTNPTTSTPDPEDTSLICSYTSTADDITRAQNNKLASYDLKMIANYTDDELIDMSITGTYNYTDAEAASEGARQARTSYTRDYTKLSINTDPFTSNYPVSGNSFTATHFAKFDEIDETNAKLLFLNVTNGSVDTSKDAVREVYTKKGYNCRDAGGSQEDETEIIEGEEAVVIEDEDAGTEIDDTIEADEEVDEPRSNSSNSTNKNSSSSSNKNSNTVGGNGDKEEEIDEDSY